MASNLSLPELYKYKWRTEAFLIKYRQDQDFELLDGSIVKLLYSPLIEEHILNRDRTKLLGPILLSDNGKSYKLSDLRKTAEFGGKGAGFGIRVENGEIESINKQLHEIKTQTLQFSIPLVIASNVYNITICTKTYGNVKSDFGFLNENNEEIAWISHKDGYKPSHFQQYSGVTEFQYHPEIYGFVNAINNRCPNGLLPNDKFGRKIDDVNLQMKSVYGVEYNINPFNKQNVTAIVQGEISFIKSDNYFMMQSHMMHVNGEMLTDEYEPILLTRFNNDREQFNIAKSRFMIMPREGKRTKEYV